MAVMVLVSVSFGWFGWKMGEAERQRKAVEAIRKAGGHVWYDYQVNEGGYEIWQPEPPNPAWLSDLLGVDFFSDVVCVGFEDPKKIDDAVLESYVALRKPERLYHSGTQLTDSRLKHLTDPPNLNSLDLGDTLVTDAGLERLKGLTNLEWLELSSTQVTAQGINELRKALPNCQICWDPPTPKTNLDQHQPQSQTPILPPKPL